MKFFHLLFVCCFIFAVVVGFSAVAPPGPQIVSTDFLQALRLGRSAQAESMLGDNTCNCPPRGGWGSFLRYESGHDPNLAFLLGSNFKTGLPKVTPLKDDGPWVIPWQRPESVVVDTPITFDPAGAPLLLPLPLAFGQSITEKELKEYLLNPQRDLGAGLSLRLRSTVKPGLIKPPVIAANEKLLPEAVRKNLHPADAGSVISVSGKALPDSELETKLPRIKAMLVRLKVVRRGQIDPWKVSRFAFLNPVLNTP